MKREMQREIQEAMDKHQRDLAEAAEFKNKPYVYEIGFTTLNWVIIDREKYQEELSPIVEFWIFGYVHFHDLYRVVNIVTGAIKDVKEEVIAQWTKAEQLTQQRQSL